MSKEAVVQYEQYEQEVKNLQRLIEEAHRIIQDRPVSTSNIQELQAQIQHHEVRLSFTAPGSTVFIQKFVPSMIGITGYSFRENPSLLSSPVWSFYCE